MIVAMMAAVCAVVSAAQWVGLVGGEGRRRRWSSGEEGGEILKGRVKCEKSSKFVKLF